METKEKGLTLSVAKGGEEAKSNFMASCRYLEAILRECSKKKVGLADSVETLRVDLTRRTKKLGAEGKARSTKCDATFATEAKSHFTEKYVRAGEDAVEGGLWAADGGSSKKERVCVTFSFLLKVNGLEVDEDLSTMGTLFSAEGVWVNMLRKEQPKAWSKQFFEVQGWWRVRGPEGAVRRKTCDLGIKWPQWHALMFGGRVAVDVTVVCPQDLKKKFLKLARMFYRRRWAAKHEGFLKRISHVHAQV